MRRSNAFAYGAWITVSRLFGGLIGGLFLGTVLFHLLPGSSVENPTIMHSTIAALPALAGFLVGGWLWGAAMGRFARSGAKRRAGLAGLLGFGPITLALAMGLSLLEPVLVANYGNVIPIHRLFTMLFVTAAFLIAGVSTWALGRVLAQPRLAWRTGITAAGTFLAVNLIMEAGGWVVGGPGAAERATMLVVMISSNLIAAITAGGVLGLALAPENLADPEIQHASVHST